MVLHISLDGITGCGKTTLSDLLADFLTKKSYNCKVMSFPFNTNIQYILNNENVNGYEFCLLTALDYSIILNADFNPYDIIIWDTSMLDLFVNPLNVDVSNLWIKQVCRFVPEMDLHLIIMQEPSKKITTEEYSYDYIKQQYNYMQSVKKNTETIQYNIGKPNKMLEEIAKTIFEKLPTCNWCGRLFTKTNTHRKYCSSKCRKYSLEEQYRENNRAYYRRYKDVMSERQKGQLGSKGANLHSKADPNPLAELQKVRNAKKALGLKPIQ